MKDSHIVLHSREMTEKKVTSSGRRAKDQTSLTISLPKALKAAIEGAAASDERSVSNFLVKELQKLVKEDEVVTQTPKRRRGAAGS